jgi:uncharacterized membrane protein
MSHHESAARGQDERMIHRLLFFSDAVFAIVLTLLVIELHPPHAEIHDEAALRAGMGALTPHFIALGISFALTGGWWLVHMASTRELHAFDWPSALCNLLFLFWIALLPFAAAFFGVNYWSAEAMVIYWGINAGAAYSMALLSLVMTRDKGRLVGGATLGQRVAYALFSLGPALAFTVGAWLALNGRVDLSYFCWVLMAPAFLIAPFLLRKPKRAAT